MQERTTCVDMTLHGHGTITNNSRSSPHDARKTSYPLNTKYSNLTTGYKYPNPLNTKYSNLTTGCKHPKAHA